MTNENEDAYPISNAVVKNIRDNYLFATTSGADVFVHATDFVDGEFGQCQIGDALSLEIASSPKGPRGKNVKLTERKAGQLA